MTRPVGRRRPGNSPRGDSSALCDICGVLWYRSSLVRKPDMLLYCPDDIRGLDSVTLSEGNARDAVRIIRGRRVRDSGSQDNSGFATTLMPSGILDGLTGWWSPRDLLLGNGVRSMRDIPTSSTFLSGRNLTQPNTSERPAYDGDVTITYDASGPEFLISQSAVFVPQGASGFSAWAVGGWDDPSLSTPDYLFHVSDVGAFMTYTQAAGASRGVFIRIQSNTITGSFDNDLSGTVTVSASHNLTSLHLFQLKLTSTHLELYRDGTEIGSTQLSDPASSEFTLDYTVVGAGVTGSTKGSPTTFIGHTGPMNEVVVYPELTTSEQDLQMEEYFGRTYTELSIA